MMSLTQQQECFSFADVSGHNNLHLCDDKEQNQISTTISYNNGHEAPTSAASDDDDDRACKNPSTSPDGTLSSPPPPPPTTRNTPLQWGHKKRTRVPRTELGGHCTADDPPAEVCWRFAKASRLPPLPLPSGGTHHRSLNLRSSSSSNPHRTMVEHSYRKRLTPSLEVNYSGVDTTKPPSSLEVVTSRLELPKIHLTLSRKEKEDDFILMRGTKLSLKPKKKRPKSIEKFVQYIYPGTWLSDLSRGRYEVKEKRCSKKVFVLTFHMVFGFFFQMS